MVFLWTMPILLTCKTEDLWSSYFCRCQTVVTQEDMYSHVLSMFVENKVNMYFLLSHVICKVPLLSIFNLYLEQYKLHLCLGTYSFSSDKINDNILHSRESTLKKFRAPTGFEPLTFAIPVFYQLSYKATHCELFITQAPSVSLHSSVGRALHWYCGGHSLQSH